MTPAQSHTPDITRRPLLKVTAVVLREIPNPTYPSRTPCRLVDLTLTCGHTVTRGAVYGPRTDGRPFGSDRIARDVAMPRQARCQHCPARDPRCDRAPTQRGRIIDRCARCDSGPVITAGRLLCRPCYGLATADGTLADYPRETWPLLELVEEACRLRARYGAPIQPQVGRPKQGGATWDEIAAMLDVEPRALEKARERTGSPDPTSGRPIRDPDDVERDRLERRAVRRALALRGAPAPAPAPARPIDLDRQDDHAA